MYLIKKWQDQGVHESGEEKDEGGAPPPPAAPLKNVKNFHETLNTINVSVIRLNHTLKFTCPPV